MWIGGYVDMFSIFTFFVSVSTYPRINLFQNRFQHNLLLPFKKTNLHILINGRNMNVVITGASRGLGRAVAEVFAANGGNLFITALHEGRLYKAVEELLNKYPGVK